MSSAETIFRVERGRASQEELAAVTVVLCSVLADLEGEDGDNGSPQAPAWRPERPAAVYRSPYNWR